VTAAAEPRSFPPIEELVPHRGTMLLLDRVVAADDDAIEAECVVPAAAWYLDEERSMPSWIGIELMAQAIAAHVGFLAHARGKPPRPGVLLGCRAYHAAAARIAGGTRLRIRARQTLQDESGFAAYDCTIAGLDGELAASSLKVYQPADFDTFLQQAMAT
jgi:predicted hotdog family 3-hydroxylacyl-ACP dehydratase